MEIVPVADIPAAKETPVGNLVDLYKTCLLMERTCVLNNGIGLSAVQVGIPWKMFVVRTPEGTCDYFVNCEYSPEGEEKAESLEGCLSIRGNSGELRTFRVERWKKVRIKGLELSLIDGKLKLLPVDYIEEDPLYSVVFQHEIDHHSKGPSPDHGGILISDIGTEVELRE